MYWAAAPLFCERDSRYVCVEVVQPVYAGALHVSTKADAGVAPATATSPETIRPRQILESGRDRIDPRRGARVLPCSVMSVLPLGPFWALFWVNVGGWIAAPLMRTPSSSPSRNSVTGPPRARRGYPQLHGVPWDSESVLPARRRVTRLALPRPRRAAADL